MMWGGGGIMTSYLDLFQIPVILFYLLLRKLDAYRRLYSTRLISSYILPFFFLFLRR